MADRRQIPLVSGSADTTPLVAVLLSPQPSIAEERRAAAHLRRSARGTIISEQHLHSHFLRAENALHGIHRVSGQLATPISNKTMRRPDLSWQSIKTSTRRCDGFS